MGENKKKENNKSWNSPVSIISIIFTLAALYAQISGVPGVPLAAAVTTPPPPSSNAPFQSVGDVINWFNALADIMQVVFWIAAVMSGIYAGFLYLNGGGFLSPDGKTRSMDKAKNQFIYTIIATVMAIIAFGIPKLVDSFLRIGKP